MTETPPSSATPPPPAAPVPDESRDAAEEPRGGLQKSPGLAGFLSFFPGLGNVYNGLYLRGVTFFVLFTALINMADRGDESLWIPAAAFVWFFNVLDAYRQAKLINHGYASDLGLADEPRPAPPGQGALAAGIVIFLVGLVAFLDIQLGVDLDWLLDFWPVGLMVLGAWFVYSALRTRREEEESSLEAFED